MSFAENLRILRENYSMTQKELAEKIGVTQASICQFERGTAQPSVSVAVELARTFNTTCEKMVGLTDFDYIDIAGDKSISTEDLALAKRTVDKMRKKSLSTADKAFLQQVYEHHKESNK